MASPVDSLLKIFLFLLLGPLVVACGLQLILAIATVIVPWLILLAVVAGAVAGLTVALVLRRRLPPRPGANQLPRGTPPLGTYRVRRPRGRA
jgi:hypothetical protein